jgi:hypothetical protein
MVDVKKIIEEKGMSIKFQGVAPEGFHLIHERTLKDLEDFEIWKSWKNGEITLEELNKKNFDYN